MAEERTAGVEEEIESALVGSVGGATSAESVISGLSTTAFPPSETSKLSERWIPNQNYLRALMSLGISEEDSIKALYVTNNSSADQAAGWLFENDVDSVEVPEHILSEENLGLAGDSLNPSSMDIDELSGERHKMVFVVNSELNMSLGKTGSQIGHAAVGLFRFLMKDEFKYGRMLCQWEDSGEAKICLKGKNAQQLLDLEKKAEGMNLPCYLVEDAGLTQIPSGSLTVLSIVGRVEDVNEVTGKLSLL